MTPEQLANDMLQSLRSMTDEDHDAVIEEMIRDGIMDRDGNVLVRMPEKPPDWLIQANGEPAKAVPEETSQSTKKPRRTRKRS